MTLSACKDHKEKLKLLLFNGGYVFRENFGLETHNPV